MSDDDIAELEKKEYEKAIAKNGPKPATAITREIDNLIVKKSTEDVFKSLRLGKYLLDKYENRAKTYGFTLKDLIDVSINFYLTNYAYKEKLENEISVLRALIVRLKFILNEKAFQKIMETRKNNKIEQLMIMYAIRNQDIPEKLINAYIKGGL